MKGPRFINRRCRLKRIMRFEDPGSFCKLRKAGRTNPALRSAVNSREVVSVFCKMFGFNNYCLMADSKVLVGIGRSGRLI